MVSLPTPDGEFAVIWSCLTSEQGVTLHQELSSKAVFLACEADPNY